jgi:hypothetical protein
LRTGLLDSPFKVEEQPKRLTDREFFVLAQEKKSLENVASANINSWSTLGFRIPM